MEHAIDTLPKQIELGNQGESGWGVRYLGCP